MGLSANPSTRGDDVPRYQYACTACDEQLEVHQSFTDDALTVCPACEGRLRKVFNAVGVVFKGSGFYKTDSRKADSTTSSRSGGSDDSGSGGSGSGDSASGSGGSGTGDSTSGAGKGSSSTSSSGEKSGSSSQSSSSAA
jgi:putative FmdB family regulatory protein